MFVIKGFYPLNVATKLYSFKTSYFISRDRIKYINTDVHKKVVSVKIRI